MTPDGVEGAEWEQYRPIAERIASKYLGPVDLKGNTFAPACAREIMLALNEERCRAREAALEEAARESEAYGAGYHGPECSNTCRYRIAANIRALADRGAGRAG